MTALSNPRRTALICSAESLTSFRPERNAPRDRGAHRNCLRDIPRERENRRGGTDREVNDCNGSRREFMCVTKASLSSSWKQMVNILSSCRRRSNEPGVHCKEFRDLRSRKTCFKNPSDPSQRELKNTCLTEFVYLKIQRKHVRLVMDLSSRIYMHYENLFIHFRINDKSVVEK